MKKIKISPLVQKRLTWGLILGFLFFIPFSLFFACLNSNKKVDPYEIKQIEFKIAGNRNLIEKYHVEVLKNDEMIGFIQDSLDNHWGNREKLEKRKNEYLEQSIYYNIKIRNLKNVIKKDSIIYKSMIVKK